MVSKMNGKMVPTKVIQKTQTNLQLELVFGKVVSFAVRVHPEDGLEVLDGVVHVLVLRKLRLATQLLVRKFQSDENQSA